jgi:hypothetical protein
LREQVGRPGAHGRQLDRAPGREEGHGPDAERREQPPELVLDHVSEGTHDEQRAPGIGRFPGQVRDQGGEAGILALGEGRLDAAAGVVQHADARREAAREAGSRAPEVELDDLRGAGADEEQEPDVGPPLEQPGHDPVQLLVGVGEPGQIALLDDRRGEARLGEDHHAGGRLDEVRAGARAHDQEKGILDLAVQPDDAGQSAEHLALPALAQDRDVAAARDEGGHRNGRVAAHPTSPSAGAASAGRSSRAARSLRTNCAALTT